MEAFGRVGPQRLNMPLSERLTKANQYQAADGPSSFIELIQSGVANVNTAQNNATAQVNEMMTGGEVSQVEVFTSVQKADMAFRLLVQVRNKLMQAYEEINAIRI
ncbi:MAG: flagellar hook-basal body complex protein FliE [Pirellulaceae bacterium]|nr:flagellar hook-basal body complex protein FliE [Pirellulaceae bacterium]